MKKKVISKRVSIKQDKENQYYINLTEDIIQDANFELSDSLEFDVIIDSDTEEKCILISKVVTKKIVSAKVK